MNMGAYFHVAPRLKTCMLEEGRTPDHQMPYTGRPPCASTATGFGKVGLHAAGPCLASLLMPCLHTAVSCCVSQHRPLWAAHS